MIEFEHRFRIENSKDLEEKISKFGFKKTMTKQQVDLIFEKDEFSNLDTFPNGYWMLRLRLQTGSKPILEMKERIDDHNWDEFPFEIDNPKNAVHVLSKILKPSRIISKKRTVWKSSDSKVEIAFDSVDLLGDFVELEGPEKDVMKLINDMNLDIKESQPAYGTLIFRIQKQGKIQFSISDFNDAVEKIAGSEIE